MPMIPRGIRRNGNAGLRLAPLLAGVLIAGPATASQSLDCSCKAVRSKGGPCNFFANVEGKTFRFGAEQSARGSGSFRIRRRNGERVLEASIVGTATSADQKVFLVFRGGGEAAVYFNAITTQEPDYTANCSGRLAGP